LFSVEDIGPAFQKKTGMYMVGITADTGLEVNLPGIVEQNSLFF
jgi:hypothetical protein